MNTKLKCLINVQKKAFSKQLSSKDYMYHHDFSPFHIPDATPLNMGLTLFDATRVYFYLFALVALGTKLPFYFLMRRKKYVSNPDYMLDLKNK